MRGRRILAAAGALMLVAAAACRSPSPAPPAADPGAPAPGGAPPSDAGPAPAAAPLEVAPQPAEADGGRQNVVRWATASELDNFGFTVYRAQSPDGPWRAISDLIEGAGTSDEPHYYRFVDRDIEPGKTYYYYVESISMSGVRERMTPVGEAPAKPRD